MRIEVTFRHLAASAALRSYATEKVGRVRKLLSRPVSAQVTLALDGFRNVAEVSVRGVGAPLTASAHSEEDMYAAIDLVVDKVERQARRYKEKLRDHRSTPTAALAVHPEPDVDDALAEAAS